MQFGIDNIVQIPEESRQHTYNEARKEREIPSSNGNGEDKKDTKSWKFGEMEFEAAMRMLDAAVSYLTF